MTMGLENRRYSIKITYKFLFTKIMYPGKLPRL